MSWAHGGTAVLAAFLASLVEFVEALTIVLAVGTIRGWRSSLVGTAAGVLFLTLLVILFGPALQHVPLTALQLFVGILLLLFGMRWLRKAILRAAGVIGMHDETAIYRKETAELQSEAPAPATATLDALGVVTSFKAVTLEGLEVIFIVIATGVGGMLLPASAGAAAAGILVVIAGAIVHKPLARVPENSLKFSVGILLSAFGVFWIGEGLRFEWRGEDLALIGLIAGFLLVSGIAITTAKRRALA